MNNIFKCPFCGDTHTLTMPNHWFFCLGEFPLNWLECSEYIKQKSDEDTNKAQHFWTVLKYHISHTYLFVQRRPNQGLYPVDYEQIIERNVLPNPSEQIDELILFLGKKSRTWGENIDLNWDKKDGVHYQLESWIGAINKENFNAVLDQATQLKLISTFSSPTLETSYICLQFAGWNYFHKLAKYQKNSKQIFMAMQFNEEARNFVNTHLKPLTKKLGFDLKLLDEIISEENLIDDKLRVEIKHSRLLVCDLTHGNQGAYWEAGYAEGLDIPVLYICRHDVLKSKAKGKKPHFDVDHQVIYSWEENNTESIKKFKEQLEAKIVLLTQ